MLPVLSPGPGGACGSAPRRRCGGPRFESLQLRPDDPGRSPSHGGLSRLWSQSAQPLLAATGRPCGRPPEIPLPLAGRPSGGLRLSRRRGGVGPALRPASSSVTPGASALPRERAPVFRWITRAFEEDWAGRDERARTGPCDHRRCAGTARRRGRVRQVWGHGRLRRRGARGRSRPRRCHHDLHQQAGLPQLGLHAGPHGRVVLVDPFVPGSVVFSEQRHVAQPHLRGQQTRPVGPRS